MAKARDIEALDRAGLSFREAGRRAVAVRAQEMLDHAEGVLDVSDIERVHDMRVATRRLRAVLEVFAVAFVPHAHKAVLRDVKAVADALGARRDPDVQLAALSALAAQLPDADQPGLAAFADHLRAEQERGNAQLAAALATMRDHRLAERLRELTDVAS
jgi:CHAD domain-containing protein